MLQVAFLGSFRPNTWRRMGGAGIQFAIRAAALALNLNWLAILLYADAFVSPSGTGSTYTPPRAHDLRHGTKRHGS